MLSQTRIRHVGLALRVEIRSYGSGQIVTHGVALESSVVVVVAATSAVLVAVVVAVLLLLLAKLVLELLL